MQIFVIITDTHALKGTDYHGKNFKRALKIIKIIYDVLLHLTWFKALIIE